MIRTKIVATLGPACSSPDVLVRMFAAGVDVCRLNFSHGTLDGTLQLLRNAREAIMRAGKPVAILGDLCGPKIRLGKVEDMSGTGGMPIETGQSLILLRREIVGSDGRVSSTLPQLVDEVEVGHRVLIEDGLLRFVCTDKHADELVLACTAGGILKSSKGINLPNSKITVPSITERDWECVDWAIDNGLDYLGLSFVRRPEDLTELRDYLKSKVSDINLIAKIEKSEALNQIDAIIEVSDGLMVARGDLGVEMDLAMVPIIQKDLIRRCQFAGKPVIVATQMLQSMVENSTPTRAEVSDVANAIIDGTDAIMLSGETSVGKHPVETVHVMAHVAEVTEEYQVKTLAPTAPPVVNSAAATAAMARGAWRIAHDIDAKLVVVWTTTGQTARVFSKHRFSVPIIAMSNDHRILRRMAIQFGVIPREMLAANDLTVLIDQVDEMVLTMKLAALNDRILVVAGWSPGTPGTMNGLVLHTVGQKWTPVPNPHILRQLIKSERE